MKLFPIIKRAAAMAALFAFVACQPETAKIDLETLNPEQDVLITISTSYGEMKAILYDQTPAHKANFVKLVNEKFYDGTLFHRVMPEFMIQGGDPDSKNAEAGQALGRGELPYKVLAEIRPGLYHERGALAAARKSDQVNPDKESNGSQFYVVQGKVFSNQELEKVFTDYAQLYAYFDSLVRRPDQMPLLNQAMSIQNQGDPAKMQQFIISQKAAIESVYQVTLTKPIADQQRQIYTTVGGFPSLDGEYTVFGKVLSGLEVIEKIANLPRDANDRPLENVSMTVTAEVWERKAITETFGYQY